MPIETLILEVYGAVEDGEFDTYESACAALKLDAETTAFVLNAIAEDLRSA